MQTVKELGLKPEISSMLVWNTVSEWNWRKEFEGVMNACLLYITSIFYVETYIYLHQKFDFVLLYEAFSKSKRYNYLSNFFQIMNTIKSKKKI